MLAAAWDLSQKDPQVFYRPGKKPKARRWRIRVWVQGEDETVEQVIIPEKKCHLIDLLTLAKESAEELEKEVEGFIGQGFEIHILRGRGR